MQLRLGLNIIKKNLIVVQNYIYAHILRTLFFFLPILRFKKKKLRKIHESFIILIFRKEKHRIKRYMTFKDEYNILINN